MTPRLARPEEAGELRDLVRTAYAHYVPRLGREPMPMTDDHAARIAAGQAWVMEADAGLLGVMALEDTADGLLLDNLAVPAASRGRGHGRAMIAFAEAEARRRGHGRLWLYTHVLMVENIALYTRLGFSETHREDRDGRHRVFLEKRL